MDSRLRGNDDWVRNKEVPDETINSSYTFTLGTIQ